MKVKKKRSAAVLLFFLTKTMTKTKTCHPDDKANACLVYSV